MCDAANTTGCEYQQKVTLTFGQYPERNYVALILGPRGRTLSEIERKTGARIAIRLTGGPEDSSYEPHCLVRGHSQQEVDAAVSEIAALLSVYNKYMEQEGR